MIRAYIVDDEAYSLNLMGIFLRRIEGVEVVGQATDPFEALEEVRLLRPDVVFLDIEMPGISGIELAERIANEQPDVNLVFVTAYDRYAVHAFDQGALDYLLKPPEMDRLLKTVQRIRKSREAALALNVSETGMPGQENPRRLKIRLLGSLEAENDRKELLRFRTAKEKELFAYLALHAGGRVHRDTLIDALWPDEDPHRAKVYLHTCVSLLRKDMKNAGFLAMLLYDNEHYYLDSAQVSADLAELQELLASPRRDNPDAMARMSNLYRGTLMQGNEYPWTVGPAAYLENNMTELNGNLLKRHMDARDRTGAVRLALRMLEGNAYSEEAYDALLRCYLDSGRQEEASRVYRQFLRMAEELRIKPSPAIVRLYEQSFA